MNNKDKDDDLLKFADELAEYIKRHSVGVSVIDPGRIKQMNLVFELLKREFANTGCSISSDITTDEFAGGCIRIAGKNITFIHPELFAIISKYASNVDIYPKVDGSIEMDMMFYGTSIKISEG